MAKSYVRQSLNPVVAARTGGVIPSGAEIRLVGKYADALAPMETPILSQVKTSGSVDQMKNEWGQSYYPDLSGLLGAAVANNATQINVGTGNGKLLHQYAVLAIYDWLDAAKTIKDPTTRETVIVTDADPGDTVTVIRDAENRADAATPASGSWPTHQSGAAWEIVGVAMPFNKDFNRSPRTRGDLVYNYSQRFYGLVDADEAAQNTPTYEIKGNPLLHDFEVETKRLKHLLERAVVSGVRMEGDGADLPYLMGGLDWMIRTYAPSGNVVNCAQNPLSAYDLEDVLRMQFKNISDGGAKQALMGPDTAAIIDTILNPYKQATMNETSATFMTTSLKFRWGTINIEPVQHMPEGSIILVDLKKNVRVKPYKGMDWKTKEIATGGPYDKRAIYGQFTLEIDEIPRSSIIHNFSLDPDLYPRRQFA